uniref:NPH3 domain-containing protein n=1 Tax=Oryza glaberrima TaxID=4538 RepID=I1QCJ8_ORYGL
MSVSLSPSSAFLLHSLSLTPLGAGRPAAQPPGGRATDSSLEWEPVKDDALVYVRVELTAWNVEPLRCAAEYLEMTEEHAEDNLTARVEAYLEQAVLRHPCEATKALKSREELLPHAEELGIVSRCVEAISIFTSG